MNRLRWHHWFSIFCLCNLTALGLWFVLRQTSEAPQRSRGQAGIPLTLGVAEHSPGALVFIAKDRGFFTDQGLDVHIKSYSSGVGTLQALARGDADVVNTADVPLAVQVLMGEPLAVTAAIAVTNNEFQIVARKDHGIHAPRDLLHKKIGTNKLAAVHFFLHCFLTFYQIPEQETAIVFYPPDELPLALARGDIDAFAMREPHTEQAKRLLGDQAVIFEKSALYERRELFVTRKTELNRHFERMDRLLKALVLAAGYAQSYPDKAISIVANRLNVPPATIAALWPTMRLDVRLDQSLIVLLEEEARWLTEGRLVDSKMEPNFLTVIAPAALESVEQSRVTFVH